MWDCHEHKNELNVSTENSIYHPTEGVLCWSERGYDCVIYHPIRFKDKKAAQKWIVDGCIADVQQSLGLLSVGFSKVTVKESCLT